MQKGAEWIGAWWCQSLVRAEEPGPVNTSPQRREIEGAGWRGGASTGEEAPEAEFVCLGLQRRRRRGGGQGQGGGGGGNKLSHCRKVCSSKSHLPTCTRAMPEGCRVKGQDVPLQSAQITYPLQSINRLLSLLQYWPFFYRLDCGTSSQWFTVYLSLRQVLYQDTWYGPVEKHYLLLLNSFMSWIFSIWPP